MNIDEELTTILKNNSNLKKIERIFRTKYIFFINRI